MITDSRWRELEQRIEELESDLWRLRWAVRRLAAGLDQHGLARLLEEDEAEKSRSGAVEKNDDTV